MHLNVFNWTILVFLGCDANKTPNEMVTNANNNARHFVQMVTDTNSFVQMGLTGSQQNNVICSSSCSYENGVDLRCRCSVIMTSLSGQQSTLGLSCSVDRYDHNNLDCYIIIPNNTANH